MNQTRELDFRRNGMGGIACKVTNGINPCS